VAVEAAVLVDLVHVLDVACLARNGLVFALEYEARVLESFEQRSFELRKR
jgi:hypothetical protein